MIENLDQHLDVPSTEVLERIELDDSVLLIRLSAIGDALRMIPAIRFLRNNGFIGKIGCAVHSPIQQILELWNVIDRVHVINRDHLPFHPFRYVGEIRSLASEEYDWVFDLHGLIKSGLVTLFSGGENRVGWHPHNSKEKNHWFQQTTISPLPEGLPRILKYVQVLRPFLTNDTLSRKQLTEPGPNYETVSEEVRKEARKRPILVQVPTSHSRYGNRKEWGEDNFTELIRRILPVLEVPLRLTWGPGEYERALSVSESFDDRVRPIVDTDLAELTYMIDRGTLMISGDTAPMHLADVLGTPLVAIFGGSDYHINGPMLTDYRLITARADEAETDNIPVGRVEKGVRDILENCARSARSKG